MSNYKFRYYHNKADCIVKVIFHDGTLPNNPLTTIEETVTGVQAYDDLVIRYNDQLPSYGDLTPIAIQVNNCLITEAGDYLITEAGEYINW